MNISIHYEARYDYEDDASFSPHIVRLFPRTDRSCRIQRSHFEAEGCQDVQYRRDHFDNEVAHCFYPRDRDRLHFLLELDLELEEKNPFHFLLESHALELPLTYKPREAAVLAPFLGHGEDVSLPAALTPRPTRRPTIEALVDLNAWIFGNLAYERREEGEAWPPGKTLAAGRGACRDFSVLLVAVLHAHGLAARLASGYLWEPPEVDAADRKAESALHAWVETFVPGAGWIGLDPTSGVLCDHHRIAAAVGLVADDISPIQGLYYGRTPIKSRMATSLRILPR